MQRRQPLRHRLSLSRRTHSWHPWRLRRTALSLRRTQRPRPRGPHMHRPSRGLSVGSALPRWAWARCSVSKRSPTPTRRVTLAPKTSAMTRKARQPQTALTPRRRFPTSRSCSAEWRWPRASSCTSPCRRSMARKSDSHRRSLRRVLAWRYTESSNYERKIFALASVARRGIARRSLHFQRHARLPSHRRHSRRDVLGALRRILRSTALAQSSDTADFLEYCTQSGPGGGNACTLAQGAPDCEGYCTLYGAACGGDSHNPFMGQLPDDNSGSQAECIEKCKAVQPITDHEQPNSGYTWQSGKASGDTLGCRLYFVSAAVVDPAANCDFAGIRPAGACLGADSKPNCDNFCLALTTACQGELSVYESFDQCKAVCQATAPGTKQSTTPENTIGCRSAHEFNALLISAHDHCPHIGPLGAGVCGDSKKGGNCEAYCSLAEKACDKSFATNFSGHADCVDKCSKFKGADQGDYSVVEAKEPGDTVQCRGLAVSQALAATSAEDRTKACAAVFGAAPCSD